MKQIFIISLLFFSICNTISQNKTIQGDTAYWYRWEKPLIKKLNLKDLSTSKDEFNFRFWGYGQIIEISKNKDSISGELTNYIYRSNFRIINKDKTDTLFNKETIDRETCYKIYKLIKDSCFLNLESDNKIKGWSQGCDGITYTIEHSDNKNYWFKNYWTPQSQDSIPEAVILINFIKNISDTLKLKDEYDAFKNTIPHRGCYNSGGMINTCYPSPLRFGYFGSGKLPYGYSVSYFKQYIGDKKIDVGFSINHKMNFRGDYDFDVHGVKFNLFSKKYDALIFCFRNRKLGFLNNKTNFQNYGAYYMPNIKKINIGIGIDYLKSYYSKLGGLIILSKYFSKPKVSITTTSLIYNNQFDYRIEVSRAIHWNNDYIINGGKVEIGYENFLNYNDINFSFIFSF